MIRAAAIYSSGREYVYLLLLVNNELRDISLSNISRYKNEI